MYAHTSFRGAKTCKIGKKGMFLVILTNFGKDMMHKCHKLRKMHAKMRISQALEYGNYSERPHFWSSTTLNWLTPDFINEYIFEVCFNIFTPISFVLDRWINAFDPDSTKHGQAGWIENIDGDFALCLNTGSWHTNIMIMWELKNSKFSGNSIIFDW